MINYVPGALLQFNETGFPIGTIFAIISKSSFFIHLSMDYYFS